MSTTLAHSGHLSNHVHHKHLRSDNTLYVIGVCSNPVRYHSRYRLAREWVKRMEATPNVKLFLVETAFGDREYEFTEQGNPQHLQLRTHSEIWIKENMINLGVRHLLPRHWRYLAWVDVDVEFRNRHWALETIHQLQHYPIVQPWQTSSNLGPTGKVMKMFNSVGEMNRLGQEPGEKKSKRYKGDPYIFGHCGYAWACTRAFYENVRELIDFAILGSADHHMALGCRGYYSHSVHSAIKGPFMELCHAWQTRAMQMTHGRIGVVDGAIEHYFHGPMDRRNYVGRWEILIQNGFDPVHDLRHDAQGLIQLSGKPHLEHAIQEYNRSRFEDSIEEI